MCTQLAMETLLSVLDLVTGCAYGKTEVLIVPKVKSLEEGGRRG